MTLPSTTRLRQYSISLDSGISSKCDQLLLRLSILLLISSSAILVLRLLHAVDDRNMQGSQEKSYHARVRLYANRLIAYYL